MNDLTPWLRCLRIDQRSAAAAFPVILTELESLGFTLQNPDAIDGGYRLEFRKGDKWAIIDRYMIFPTQGEAPGIALYCDFREFECTLSTRTPLDIITKALTILASDEAE